MKKPIVIILAAIMMFALCACGNTATDSSDSGPTYVFTANVKYFVRKR